MGIGYNTRQKTITYSIFKSSAFAALMANRRHWTTNGKAAEYDDDIATLYKFFSRKIGKGGGTIKFIYANKEDCEHHKYTLISENGFWYVSERDPARAKIVKGALVNAFLIREWTTHLESFETGAATTLATAVLGFALTDPVYGAVFSALGLLPQALGKVIDRVHPDVLKQKPPNPLDTIQKELIQKSTAIKFRTIMRETQ
jgi:hypothetical protein